MKRHSNASRRNRPGARYGWDGEFAIRIIVRTPALRESPSVFHPSESVGVLFDGEDFARVFFDSAVAFPDAAGFARVLQCGTEVGRAFLAEGFLHYVQLLAVAAWDVDFDLDGTVDVAYWSSNATGEASTALERCESLERHCYSAEVRH